MIRVVRQGARWSAVLLALGLLVGPVTAVEAAEEDDDAQAETEREVAQIKIEIKLENGRVVRPKDVFTVEWGVQNELAIEADGSNHQFNLTVERKEAKGKELSMTVGYNRDDEAIIAPYTFDTKVKKREVVRIEGGMAIALTVTPKKVKGDAPADEEELPPEEVEPPREKIEIDDDVDDPLGGLE